MFCKDPYVKINELIPVVLSLIFFCFVVDILMSEWFPVRSLKKKKKKNNQIIKQCGDRIH